jgi:hypothetical protein
MSDINPEYIDENGCIKMCPDCRNVKIANGPEKWVLDTVLYVNPPENAVLERCPDCIDK